MKRNWLRNCLIAVTTSVMAVSASFSVMPVFAASPLNGWINSSGQWSYYTNGTKLLNQWKADSKGWCYLGNDGNLLRDAFQSDSRGTCYLGADGYWFKSGGWKENSTTKAWYCIGSNGYALKNAWKQDSAGWCYLGADGAWVTNSWVKDSKGWCYINGNGYWNGQAQIQAGNINDLNDGAVHEGMYIISSTGTFGSGNSASPTVINGDVIINIVNASAADVINLNNLNIKGKLTVNFGAGTLNLNNIKVNSVDVTNIGKNSLNVSGTSYIGTLTIQDINNDAHIVISGDANILNTIVHSGAVLQVASGATNAAPFSSIVIAPAAAPSNTNQIQFVGSFPKSAVDVAAPANLSLDSGAVLGRITANSDLSLIGDGTVAVLTLSGASQNLNLDIPVVGTLVVNDNATGSNINIPEGSTIITLNISAPVAVTGTGTIETANIGATGTTIETAPETTAVTPGVTANVGGETANDSNSTVINKVPAPGEEPAAPSGGGGGGGGSTTYTSAEKITKASLEGTLAFSNTTLLKSGVDYSANINTSAGGQLTGISFECSGNPIVNSVKVSGGTFQETIPLGETLNSSSTLTINYLLDKYYHVSDNLPDGVSMNTLKLMFGNQVNFVFTMSDGSTINVTVNLN